MFKVLAEARHYLTHVCGAAEELENETSQTKQNGHLFAPVNLLHIN